MRALCSLYSSADATHSSIIRFAAGRISYTEAEQALCFMAGANAVCLLRRFGRRSLTLAQVFTGERMLTTPTSGWDEDGALMGRWGLTGLKSFETERMKVQARAGVETVTM